MKKTEEHPMTITKARAVRHFVAEKFGLTNNEQFSLSINYVLLIYSVCLCVYYIYIMINDFFLNCVLFIR